MTPILKTAFAVLGLMSAIVAGTGFWFYGFWREQAYLSVTALPPARPALSGFPPALDAAIADAESAVQNSADDPEAWIALGRLYHANGFSNEARACYVAALRTEPEGGTAQVHYYLADLAMAAGDLEEAARKLQDTVDLAADYLPAYLRLGEVLYKSGVPEGAAKAYEKARQLDADNPDAMVGLAREYLRCNDDAHALELLQQLVSAHPDFTTGLTLLAQLLERRGETAQAASLRVRQRRLKDTPTDDPWMDEVRPYCADMQRLGFYFEDTFKMGRVQEAMGYIDRMETLEPGSWHPHYLRGYALCQLNRLEEAVPEFQRAIALGGDYVAIYDELTKSLIKLRRLAEAEEVVRAGLAVAPDNVTLLVAQAGFYMERHEYDAAIAWPQKALALDAGNVAANKAMAYIYLEKDQLDKAVPYLQQVRRSSPPDYTICTLLGRFFLEHDRPEEAIEPLAQAVGLQPENPGLVSMLSLAHLRFGDRQAEQSELTAAIASYDHAIAVDPENVEAQANKIQALVRLHEFDRAEQAIQLLIKRQPRDPALWVSLGDIQYWAGRHGQAKATWSHASQLVKRAGNPALAEAVASRLQ